MPLAFFAGISSFLTQPILPIPWLAHPILIPPCEQHLLTGVTHTLCRVGTAQGHLARTGGHGLKPSQVIQPTKGLCLLGRRVPFPNLKKGTGEPLQGGSVCIDEVNFSSVLVIST